MQFMVTPVAGGVGLTLIVFGIIFVLIGLFEKSRKSPWER